MVNVSLRDRILKTSTLSTTSILADSILFQHKDSVQTRVPMINVALSGSVDGGMLPGLLQIAGESKHFKTAFGLLLVTSFLEKYQDGIIIFYDSEFGTPKSYFQTFRIDPNRAVHCPITNIEELKFDITAQLQALTNKDKVMIFIDSIGNLASLKEVEDALDQKTVADMSRAKQLKSLFRIVTPHLTLKGIPMVVINHVYKEIGMFPKDIVGGGTGSYYSSNDIWIIGRQQEKDGKDLSGFNFIINIEKSRKVREKSKIPITVTFEEGINTWSGLFDLALEFGILVSPSSGWYCIHNVPEHKLRKADIISSGLLGTLLETTELKQLIENKYSLSPSNGGEQDAGNNETS